MSPRIRFLIGGVQKAGTSALASYLADHPALVLPRDKEAHVFDAPGFDEQWGVAEIDVLYARRLPDENGRLAGDATPIYCLHPRLVQRIARYNPAMRWIILLRDPVDRARRFIERVDHERAAQRARATHGMLKLAGLSRHPPPGG